MASHHRSILLVTTALQTAAMLLLSLPVHAQPAPNARPLGGTVVGGSAVISQTTNNTSINQSTQRAAVNWNSFNVGSQQSVTFAQPNASAVTLNRVTGPDPSQIAGRIDANGQVILVNQSGVTFYKGAQVNSNGLMVSAIGASDQSVKNFLTSNAGTLALDQPGNPNARVENDGNITVGQAGLAALVAPQVANSGTISAQLGHVVLAGAKTATLDLYGDGLLSLDVTNQVTQAPAGATALVTNSGVIVADGGTVRLTARAADGIVQNLVQSGGKIRAATVGDQTGTIALNGVGGSIVVTGQLSARGTAAGTTGGNIEIVSDGNVAVASTARINASGQAGGGAVAIGTTLARAKGGPTVTPTLTAANVGIQHGAKIAANAIANGNGGHIAVLSTNSTQMDGAIAARGSQGGNGGFVEVSGDILGMTGAVDLSAPSGAIGTLLLDPTFLDVVNGVAGAGSEDANFTTNGGSVFYNDGNTGTPDTISNGVIDAFGANVLLQAKNTLTVAANISLTTNPGQNLTMEAGGTLTIDPGVVVTASGNVILATGGAGPTPPPARASPLISISGAVNSTGGSVSLLSGPAGAIDINAGGSVAGATVTLTGGTGGIAMTGNAALGQIGSAIDISSTGGVTQASTSTIIANRLGSSGGVTGTASFLGTGNAINVVTNFTATGGDLVVVDSKNLTLAGIQTANNLFFEVANAGGTLTLGEVRPIAPAIVTAGTGGRIALVADNYAVGNTNSKITTTAGTVELAPFSTIATSILGISGLIVNSSLLSIIQTNGGTLEVGGFTNIPGGATTPVASAASVNIDAAVDLTGIATTLRLDATGAITEPGGPLTVSNLTGTGAAWSLTTTGNAISTLGDVSATSFALADGKSLAVNGTVAGSSSVNIADHSGLSIGGAVNSPAIILAGASVTIPGTVNDGGAGTVLLGATTGTITETGTLVAGTLTGTSVGAANLTGTNQVAKLGNFNASALTLNDGVDLLIDGPLVAPNIRIIAPANQVTLDNGGAIATGGTVRPAGPIQPALEPANGGPGAYIQAAGFTQVGLSTLLGSSGGAATLQISVTGNMQFDPPVGLQAQGSWLILNLTTGTAAGDVFVNSLDVSYTAPGSTRLLGTIAGITGGPAAAAGFIQPAINVNYLFNGCVIAAAVCQPPPTPIVPVTLPTTTPTTTATGIPNDDQTAALGGLYPFLPGAPPPLIGLPNLVVVSLPMLPAPAPQLTDPDVVPPNISYLDY